VSALGWSALAVGVSFALLATAYVLWVQARRLADEADQVLRRAAAAHEAATHQLDAARTGREGSAGS
jgi:hypothetical protein